MYRRDGSFENLTDEQIETHLKIAHYDGFTLTDAVRPAFDLAVVPRSGFRHDRYRDEGGGIDIPVLMAAASREDLFDLFMDLIDPVGGEVDVVLETSHEKRHSHHDDLYREGIDLPVLKSILYDFEDMLLNDGCSGISICNPQRQREVRFDEHKLLIVFSHELNEFEAVLVDHGLNFDDEMKFITEAEHVHSSSDEFSRQFQELRYLLGLDGC
jgi:hypothetical protein